MNVATLLRLTGRQTVVCPTLVNAWLRPPSPFFLQVFILKTLKVMCFYRFTQVFILKDLVALICTKIVQVSQVLQTKGLELYKGSRKQKRQQAAGATESGRKNIQEQLYTRSNSLSRKMRAGVK